MSEMIERVASAMQNAVIRDDEGEFPRLFDMLGFSGENKSRTVVKALARAAVAAMRDPTQEMIAAMEGDGGHSIYRWEAAISAALQDEAP